MYYYYCIGLFFAIITYYVYSDINECDSINPCNDNATCADTFGSFTCTCNAGFTGDGTVCQSNNYCYAHFIYMYITKLNCTSLYRYQWMWI